MIRNELDARAAELDVKERELNFKLAEPKGQEKTTRESGRREF